MNDKATILAVDDTTESLTLLVNTLAAEGYQVRPADSGELALAAVDANRPDLILLDVRMKGMDGFEVCRRLKAREETQDIPIILISAFAEAKEWVKGLQLGAVDYVTKPFQTEELLTRVKTHLALRRANILFGEQAAALGHSNEQLQSEIGERQRVEHELRKSLDRAERSRRTILSALEDQKQAEEEREALRAQAMQSQKLESMGTLAGGVAHEINNPINGIMNYAQLIKDRLDPDSPLKEFASEIIEETERVAVIVRNLLAFARQEKQAHSPALISTIVETTLSLIGTVIRHDQIQFEVEVPEDLPTIRCRSQQIQQVLMNLMTNARDALNGRYPEYDENKILRVTAHPFEKEGRAWIRATVEDHGTGIAPDVRERMFDPFFTTKPRYVGTGLGLSISHGIVRDHHGELSVESEPGEYTRFHMDLPVDNRWFVDGSESETGALDNNEGED